MEGLLRCSFFCRSFLNCGGRCCIYCRLFGGRLSGITLLGKTTLEKLKVRIPTRARMLNFLFMV